MSSTNPKPESQVEGHTNNPASSDLSSPQPSPEQNDDNSTQNRRDSEPKETIPLVEETKTPLLDSKSLENRKLSSANGSLNVRNEEEGLGVVGHHDTTETFHPPDGGYGWVIMISALMISLIVDGLTYTFGIFLGEFERAFNSTKSTVAFAGSLQVGIYLLIGPVVSALTNRFGCRPVIIAGSLIAGLAYLISSFSQNIIVLIVIYGFFGGFGFGLMYLPSIVAVSMYFEEKRALATGIAVCGSGVGMFVLAPVTEMLLEAFAWRWTLVLLAGLVLNGMVFGALTRPLKIPEISADQTNGTNKDESPHKPKTQRSESIGSHRYRKASDGSVSLSSVSKKDGGLPKQRTISSNSAVSSGSGQHQHGNSGDAGDGGIPLMPVLEGIESITIEVLEEPVSSKRGSRPSKDDQSNQFLLPSAANGQGYSSQPAISHPHRRVSAQKNASDSSSHLAKLTASASSLVHRLQLSASRQTGMDDATRLSRARTPLGLSFVSLAPSSIAFSQEIHRSRANSTAVQSIEEEKKRSCLDCLSPGTQSIIREMLNLDILKNKKFWFVLMGNFFCMIGFYVPFVYIPERAKQLGIDESKAAFLLSVIGISNTVGRVVIGMVVQCLKLNTVLVTTIALVISGVVTALMPFSEDYVVIATLSGLFGLCVAAYIALCSVLLCDLLGVHNLTNAFGYVILFRGVACIIGPPLAGAIIDSTGLFDPAFYLGGIMIVLGGVSHLFLYVLFYCPCRGK